MTLSALTYPLLVSNGRLVTTSEYPTIVKQAIVHAVQTKKGELVWNPEHGTGYLVLDKPVPEVLAELRLAISESLRSYPDVTFKLYYELQEEGKVVVTVSYEVPDNPRNDVSITL